MSAQEIKIGALATLVGPFSALGEEGMHGVELAIAEFGGQICGKPIRLIKESSSAIPDDAVSAIEGLLDKRGVDFTIGPLSGSEGLAVRDYAKTRPDKTFLNGASAAQDTTLRDPAPNFFSFATNGVQWTAGLGTYAYETQGFRRAVTVAEDYSFPYSQVGGFMIEFCRAGGRVVKKFWVPVGATDFSAIIESIPDDIDVIFAALGGADAAGFLQQYYAQGRPAIPLIGGPVTTDQTVLNAGEHISEYLVGITTSSCIADDNPDPAWQEFVNAYHYRFPDGLWSPSVFTYCYYVNTKAGLLALQMIDGEFSEGQENFKEALRTLEFESPTGPVRLDHNRQAIANIFIRVVDKLNDGRLYNRLLKTIPAVNQTLGIPEAEYLEIGPLTRDNPRCS